MVKRPRGDMGVRPEQIAQVLSKAGWEARRGHGDHIVLSKPGHRQIVLAQRVTMAQWKNIEQSVGLQVESLLNKTLRGKGKGMTEDELKKRIGLAHSMWKAGLPSSFILKHTGTVNARLLPNFTPKVFAQRGMDEVLQQYLPNLRQHSDEVESHIPPALRQRAEEVERAEPTAPPSVVSEEVAQPQPSDDLTAILELLNEQAVNVRQIVEGRQQQSKAFLAAIRRTVELRKHLDGELEALLGELEAAWQGAEV